MPRKKHHRAHSRLRSLLPRPMLGQVLLDWQGEPPVVQLSEERQVRCWLYADAAEKKEG